MENYTKRSKNVLPLNKILLIITFFLFGCKGRAQSEPIPQKVNVQINIPGEKYNQSLYWSVNKINDKKNENLTETLHTILKKYAVKNDKISLKGKPLNKIYINFIINNEFSKSIIVEDGLPNSEYLYHVSGVPSYRYSDNGGIIPMANQLNIFKKGYGHWTDYYYVDYFKNKKFKETENAVLKEEGEVKSNFKFGQWKYYNKTGKIDSVKTYTLKDSVDVRFPHCIFNKNEPCY